MFFFKKRAEQAAAADKAEFLRLWNDELKKDVDRRDFTKAYNFALKKRSIRNFAFTDYLNFESEDSPRFHEACDAFDEGDIMWTFMLIRQFASVPQLKAPLKYYTNKCRVFLSDKRKASVISRHSTRWYIHDLMKNEKAGENFISLALEDAKEYEALKKEGKYLSAYKIAALTEKTGEYTTNIKKYLYYAAKRPLTAENQKQTEDYFKYVEKYYNFKRRLHGGGDIIIKDIDIVTALAAYRHNGGNVDYEELKADLHRTVKVYCRESMFAPVCLLADYLYEIDEFELEKMTLSMLTRHGEAIDEKYKKRYTMLELMDEKSQSFIFRIPPHTPLECVPINENCTDIAGFISDCVNKKPKNTWCAIIKHTVKTFELNAKYYYEDRVLTSLEDVLDREFGDYVLESAVHMYFTGDEFQHSKSRHSMLIVTSGKNRFADFPKIGLMVKLEPITKNLINIHYCRLYLPDDSYTPETLRSEAEYIKSAMDGNLGTRFDTYESTIENLTWSTVNKLLEK